MNTILTVDDELHSIRIGFSFRSLMILIDTSGTHSTQQPSVGPHVGLDVGSSRLGSNGEVDRLVLGVIGSGERDGSEDVKGELPVW